MNPAERALLVAVAAHLESYAREKGHLASAAHIGQRLTEAHAAWGAEAAKEAYIKAHPEPPEYVNQAAIDAGCQCSRCQQKRAAQGEALKVTARIPTATETLARLSESPSRQGQMKWEPPTPPVMMERERTFTEIRCPHCGQTSTGPVVFCGPHHAKKSIEEAVRQAAGKLVKENLFFLRPEDTAALVAAVLEALP